MSAFERLSDGYYNSRAVTADNPGGLSAGGHLINFPAALVDVGQLVAEAAETVDLLEAAVAP